MRYRPLMLCALVSCGFASCVFVGEPVQSLEKSNTRALVGTPTFVTAVFDFRDARGLIFNQPGAAASRFVVPASRHIATTDTGSLAAWGRENVERIGVQFNTWLEYGMKHTPALVMGLFLILAVPPLAFTGWFFRWVHADPNATRRLAGAGRNVGDGRLDELIEGAPMAYARNAMLEIHKPGAVATVGQYRLSRNDLVVRIGREDDNEIQIRDRTVHRYHAAIDRSMDGGIAISDLSSKKGNGVVVNGERVARARLKDGDRIGLGAVSLTFRVNPQ